MELLSGQGFRPSPRRLRPRGSGKPKVMLAGNIGKFSHVIPHPREDLALLRAESANTNDFLTTTLARRRVVRTPRAYIAERSVYRGEGKWNEWRAHCEQARKAASRLERVPSWHCVCPVWFP